MGEDASRSLDVTVYDALYVVLAGCRNEIRVTADRKLARTVRGLREGGGVRVLGEG